MRNLVLVVFLFLSHQSFTQSNFGLEIKAGRNITTNSGTILGSTPNLSGYIIDKEQNISTNNYGIGVYYNKSNKHFFKLHFGRYQNGRLLDLSLIDDVSGPRPFQNIKATYSYFQICPSYAYAFRLGKVSIPIELGICINKRINVLDIKYVGISKYNFDMKLSYGATYNLAEDLNLGVNFVYFHALKDYQDKDLVRGVFNPRQYGLELVVAYNFKIKL